MTYATYIFIAAVLTVAVIIIRTSSPVKPDKQYIVKVAGEIPKDDM